MKKFLSEFNSMEELFKALEKPENKYRIHPIEHNLCDKGTDIDSVIDRVIRTGAGGIVTNTTWLDKEWVFNRENTEKLKLASVRAREQGLDVWMYDDYYYPSGFGNGYTVKDHPEHFPESIVFACTSVKKGDALDYPERLIFAGIFDDDFKLKSACNGEKADDDGLFIAFYIKRHVQEYVLGEGRGQVKLLDRKTVQSFIDNALKPVFEVCDGSHFDAVFTDEPTLTHHVISFARGKVDFACIPAPYCDELFDEYFAEYGERLEERVYHLFTGLSDEAKRTRIRYYQTVSRIARRNYTDVIAEYLKKEGTLASGHFLLEEGLKYHVGYYADYMRVVGGQDIPGCDVLCAEGQKYFAPRAGFDTAWIFTGKYTSSLSRLKGHNVTMLEICPVVEPKRMQENSYKEFMALSTYVIFSGITHYNAYGYYFIEDEEQLRFHNTYVGRLLTVLRNSLSAARTAIYYPINQMQALFATPTPLKEGEVDFYDETESLEHSMEALSTRILDQYTDYNVIDGDALLSGEMAGGFRKGQIFADTIIVPFTEFMTEAVAKKLKEFENAGGKLIFIDRVPDKDEYGKADISAYFEGHKAISIDELTLDKDEFNVEGEGVYASPYTIQGKKLLYVINKEEKDTCVRVSKDAIIYDPETNECVKARELTLKAERGALIFEGE